MDNFHTCVCNQSQLITDSSKSLFGLFLSWEIELAEKQVIDQKVVKVFSQSPPPPLSAEENKFLKRCSPLNGGEATF